MATEIRIPVRLEVLQDSIASLKQTLANLKPDSSGWKAIQNIIISMEKEATNLQVMMSKPFGSQSQFNSAEKSIGKIDDALAKAKITMSSIKFSDLKLDANQTAQFKDFESQLKQLENEVTQFKENIKSNLQGSDLWAGINALDANATIHSFDQIVSTVSKTTAQIKAEADKAKEAIDTFEPRLKQAQTINKFFKGTDNPLREGLGDAFKDYFTNTKTGLRFASGQKNAFYEFCKNNLSLTNDQIAEIKAAKTSELEQIFKDLDVSKILKNAAGIIDQGNTNQAKYDSAIAKYEEAQKTLQGLNGYLDQVKAKSDEVQPKISSVNTQAENFRNNIAESARNNSNFTSAATNMSTALSNMRNQLAEVNIEFVRAQQVSTTFNSMKMAVANFMGFTQVLNLTKTAIKDAMSHIQELDSVMNKISIVTDMSTSDLWNQIDSYSKMAQSYGVSIKGAYEVSQIYYQQGLQTNDVLTLTNETLKLSKISGLDYASTTDYMTTALRGFKMEMEDASTVVDVYSALAANTAVSSEELAVAMSKTASSMESIGSTFEETSAMIGTMVAVTRESATNIGSALKSIASRYGEMKQDPLKLVDSEGDAMSFNKVDAALQSVGISMKTTDGQFREFTDVIVELGEKWNQLESTQQRYIATQFAGNRQQSRFLALISNIDLLKSNIDIAESSEDTGTIQALKSLDSIESKLEQVKVAYQQFYTSIGAEQVWKGALDGIKDYINYLNSLPKLFGKVPLGALSLIINVISLIKSAAQNAIVWIAQTWKNVMDNSTQDGASTYTQKLLESLRGMTGEFKAVGEQIGKAVQDGIAKSSATTAEILGKQSDKTGKVVTAAAQTEGPVTQSNVTQQILNNEEVASQLKSSLNQIDFSASAGAIKQQFEQMVAGLEQTAQGSQFAAELRAKMDEIDFSAGEEKIKEQINSILSSLSSSTIPEISIPAKVENFNLGELSSQIHDLELPLDSIEKSIKLSFKLDTVDTDFLPTLQAAINDIDFNGDGAVEQFRAIAEKLGDEATESGNKIRTAFQEAGSDAIAGLVEGLIANSGNATAQGANIGAAVIEALKTAMGCHSPSVYAMLAGQNVVEGLLQGLSERLSDATKAGSEAGKAVVESLEKELKVSDSVFDELKSSIITGLDSLGDDVASPEVKAAAINKIKSTTYDQFKSGSADSMFYTAALQRQKGMENIIDFGGAQVDAMKYYEDQGKKKTAKKIGEMTSGQFFSDEGDSRVRQEIKKRYDDTYDLSRTKKHISDEVYFGEEYPLGSKSKRTRWAATRAKMWDILQDRQRKASQREYQENVEEETRLQEEKSKELKAKRDAYKQEEAARKKEWGEKTYKRADAQFQEDLARGKAEEEAARAKSMAESEPSKIEAEEPISNVQEAVAAAEPPKPEIGPEQPEYIPSDILRSEFVDLDANSNKTKHKTMFGVGKAATGVATKTDQFGNFIEEQFNEQFETAINESLASGEISSDFVHQLQEQINENKKLAEHHASTGDTRRAATLSKAAENDQLWLDQLKSRITTPEDSEFRQAKYNIDAEYKDRLAQLQNEADNTALRNASKRVQEIEDELELYEGRDLNEEKQSYVNELKAEHAELSRKQRNIREGTEHEAIPQYLLDGAQDNYRNQLQQIAELRGAAEKAGPIEVPVEPKTESAGQLKFDLDNLGPENTITVPVEAGELPTEEIEQDIAQVEGQMTMDLPAPDTEAITDAIDNAAGKVDEAVQRVKDSWADVDFSMDDEITEAIDNGDSLYEGITDLQPDAIAEGIKEAMGQVQEAEEEAGNAGQESGQKIADGAQTGSESQGELSGRVSQTTGDLVSEGEAGQESGQQIAAGAAQAAEGQSKLSAITDKVKSAFSSLAGNSSTWGRAIGSGLSTIAGMLDRSTEAGGAFAAALTTVGGAITMLTASSPMALITGLTTVITGIISWTQNNSLEKQIERATENFEKLNNVAKETKANLNILEKGKVQLEELEKTRYDSAEAAEEYQSKVDELASTFPQLIAGFDEAGNAIIEASDMENILADARRQSAEATYQAAEAERKAAELNLQQSLANTGSAANKAISYINQSVSSGAGKTFGYENSYNNRLAQNNEGVYTLFNNLYNRVTSVSEQGIWDKQALNDILQQIYFDSAGNNQYETQGKFDVTRLEAAMIWAEDYEGQFDINKYIGILQEARDSEAESLTKEEEALLQSFEEVQEYEEENPEKTLTLADLSDTLKTLEQKSKDKDYQGVADAYATAYKQYLSLLQWLSEQGENIEDNERKLLSSTLATTGTYLEQVATEVGNVQAAAATSNASGKKLINSWIVKTNDESNFIQDKSGLTNILTQHYSDIYNAKFKEDSTYQWEDFLADQSANMMKSAEQMEKFWNDLITNGNSTKDKFVNMLNGIDNYHIEDFSDFSNIDNWDEVNLLLKEKINKRVEGLKEGIQNLYNTLFSEDSGLIDDGFIQGFIDSREDQIETVDEAQYIKNTMNKWAKLTRSGYIEDASKYLTMAGSLYDEIYEMPAEVRVAVWDYIEKYGLDTKEGIQQIIESIEASETEEDDAAIGSLKALSTILHDNLSLAIQTTLSNFIDSWGDSNKLLSKLTTGIDFTDVNTIINSEAGKKAGITIDSFKSDGEKLVLAAEDANNYINEWLAHERNVLVNRTNDLRAVGEAFGTVDENGEFALTTEITAGTTFSEDQIKKLESILGGEGSLSSYTDKDTGAVLEERVEALQNAIITKYNESRAALNELDAYLTWGYDQVQKSINWANGDYSSLENIYKDMDIPTLTNKTDANLSSYVSERLEQLVAGAKMTTAEYEQPDIKSAVDKIQTAAKNFITDLLNKDLDTLYAADYVSMGISADTIQAAIDKAKTYTAEQFANYIAALAEGYGKSLSEQNEDYINAWKKINSKQSLDGIKDVQFLDDSKFKATTEQLKTFANTYELSISKMVEDGIAHYDEAMQGWIVNYSSPKFKEYGLDLNSIQGFAETAIDSSNSFFKSITTLITNGIEGKLSVTDATNLQQYAAGMGLNEKLDFSQTQDGLELSADSARKLYSTISQINGLQGKVVFDKLKDNLIQTEDNFKSVQTTAAHVKDLAEKINVNSHSYQQQAGNVNLISHARHQISGEAMQKAGWKDFNKDEYATLYSSTYSGEDYNKNLVLNITPITNDGRKILSPSDLDAYVKDLMEKSSSADEILLNDTKHLVMGAWDVDVSDAKKLAEGIADASSEANRLHEESAVIAANISEWDKPSNDRIEQYQEELDLAEQIKQVRSTTEDDSFKFMDNKIPSGENNPLNYYQNWYEALSSLQTGFSNGYIDYTDWYNIINEFQSVADLTGQTFELGGATIQKGSDVATKMIQAAAESLRDVNSDGTLDVDFDKLKINLKDLGVDIDIDSASENAAENTAKAIKGVADDQVESLDALIELLEVVVQMQELGEIDTSNDSKIDLSEVFVDIENDDQATQYTAKYQAVAKKLMETATELGDNSELSQALKNIKIDGISLETLFSEAADGVNKSGVSANALVAALNALYQMSLSDDYDLDNIADSIYDMLLSSGIDNLSIDLGDKKFYVKGNVKYQFDFSNESAMDNAKTAIQKYLESKGIGTDEIDVQSWIDNYFANKDPKEFSAEEQGEIDWILGLASGDFTINEEVDEKGEKTGRYTGTYKGQTFTGATYNEVKTSIQTAEKIANNGFNFEIDENGSVTGNLAVGSTSIKMTVDENGNTLYWALGTPFTTKEEAIQYLAKQGYVDSTLMSNGTEIELDNGGTATVWFDSKLNIGYSIIRDKDGNTTGFKYNGKTFPTYESMMQYIEEIEPLLSKGWTSSKDANFEYIKKGKLQIKRDLKSGKIVELTFDGKQFKSQEAFDNYVAAMEKAEEQGKTINDDGTFEYDVNGQHFKVVRHQDGSFWIQGSFIGADGDMHTVEGATESQVMAIISAYTKMQGGHIASTGIPSEYYLDGKQYKIFQTGNTYTIVGPDGLPLDQELTDEIIEDLQKADGATANIDSANANIAQLNATSESANITFGEKTSANIPVSVLTDDAKESIAELSGLLSGLEKTWTAIITIAKASTFWTQYRSISSNLAQLAATRTPKYAIDTIIENYKTVSDELDALASKERKAKITLDRSDLPSSIEIEIKTKGVSEQGSNAPKAGTVGLVTGTIARRISAAVSVDGTAKAKGTLMGELGPELVVQTGRYFVAGQNGPEFVDLKDDAIVFNHLQTEQLLTNGVSPTRGHAITNERVAAAYAHGNIGGGVAMASASEALATLKQLRAMWKALSELNASDLLSKAGSGGGGGGGSSGKGYIATIERWYTYTQKIATAEEKITHQEQLRAKLASDINKDGSAYYKSQVASLKELQTQVVLYQRLASEQKEYFEQRRTELNTTGALRALYTFDENGQMIYDTKKYEKVSEIFASDANGAAKLSAKDQYDRLVEMGFKDAMKYNSSGEEVDWESEDAYATAVQNFKDRMDSEQSEMQSLHDSINEYNDAYLEAQEKQNEILQAIKDNQYEVENAVLNAIEDAAQREIDELQEQRDAIEESSSRFIDGLTNQLNKEKEKYQTDESEKSLNQKRQKLAILQRSGGSASEISALQQEIDSDAQDLYFEKQQEQIDAIQEASDREIEKLDAQIDLQQGILDYEKEHGLLWSQVEQIMEGSPESIAAFINENDSQYWAESPTKNAESMQELLFKAKQWTDYRGNIENLLQQVVDYAAEQTPSETGGGGSNGGEGGETPGGSEGAGDAAWAEFKKTQDIMGSQAWTNLSKKDKEKLKEIYLAKYEETKDATQAAQAVRDSDIYQNAAAGDSKNYYVDREKSGKFKVGDAKDLTEDEKKKVKLHTRKKTASLVKKNNTLWEKAGSPKPSKETAKQKKKYKYDIGGMVEEEGLGYLHAKEAVLTAQQADILRNDILGSGKDSFLSLISDFTSHLDDAASNAANINNSSSKSFTIQNASVNMNVDQIANDYDARRAGDMALDEILKIARKSYASNRVGG